MGTELAYLDDSFRYEFEAEVAGETQLDGRRGILLRRTYFFPTGGGQEHDTGTLGEANVTDVQIDEGGNVVHFVDGPVGGTRVPATIDAARRFAFMQHHSGQHLLSAVLDQDLGLATVSSRISIDSPSTIDTPWGAVRDEDWIKAETIANDLIYQDRPIKSYIIGDDQVPSIPFRRPPKVQGQIRVVEIEGCDYSACGGTHCTRTGMIGVCKIVKTERRGDKARFYFIAGGRALTYFQMCHATLTQAAHQLSASPEALPQALARQGEQLKAALDELEEYASERLPRQVKQLVAAAETIGAIKWVSAAFKGMPAQQLRALGQLLQAEPGVVALLANHDGAKVSVVATCAADTGLDANVLIRTPMAEIGGRGGGDARLAQGGGTADEGRIPALFETTKNLVRSINKT